MKKRRKLTVSPNSTAAFSIDEKGFAVMRPAMTKHGFRKNPGKLEFAELAIQFRYGARPPVFFDNHSKLTREVNEDWKKAGYGGEISRPTVLRALKKVFP